MPGPSPEQRRITDAFYLAFCVWREARGEAHECKVALAQSVMNRVYNPKWWGNDVASVVTKPWQYSSFTDPKDPQLVKYPAMTDPSWVECLQVAIDVIDRKASPITPGADSYYDTSIKAPNWAKPEQFVAQIGRVRFYNTDGDHPENVKT